MKKIFFLILIALISLFFNLYKKDASPPGFNADEAAFGYNAYSLLKTGRDEYGNFLPLRLKSFGDYKMPLYSYLSIPFIAIGGLNESSTRALNSFLALLLPVAVYFLAKELFQKTNIGLLAAFLTAINPGLHMAGRHAHESYLMVFLLTLSTLFFIRILKTDSWKNYLFFFLFLSLGLLSYHPVRIFALFYFVFLIGWKVYTKSLRLIPLGVFILILILFSFSDLSNNPTRVKNLLFINDKGLALSINELRGEGGNKILYNKVTIGLKRVFFEHITYYSPQFLVITGDENFRFGYPGISPLNPVEYFFIFVGIYFLFKKNHPLKVPLLLLILITPLSASLAWQQAALTRSLFILIPLILLSAYGMGGLIRTEKRSQVAIVALVGTVFLFIVFHFYSWDFYLNHYPKRAAVIQSWQSGYREVTDIIKNNYDKKDAFYISQSNGQPYIFMLFYLQFPPEKYQQEASLSSPDKYGFGQVDHFDKFYFSLNPAEVKNRYLVIGAPHDFSDANMSINRPSTPSHVIKVGTEEMFRVYDGEK